MSAIRVVVLAILAFGVAWGAGGSAAAQAYPSKPIRIVIGYAPGGSVDMVGRVVGDILARQLNATVVVENVPGAAGTWKDLTDGVNSMAGNLTGQVRNIAEVTTAVARGDLSRKITVDVRGEILELKNTINTMVDQLNAFASEVTRVAREVGTEGKLGGQAQVPGVAGTWKDLTGNVNLLAANLTTVSSDAELRDAGYDPAAVRPDALLKQRQQPTREPIRRSSLRHHRDARGSR